MNTFKKYLPYIIGGSLMASGLLISNLASQRDGFEDNINNLLKSGCTLRDVDGNIVNKVKVEGKSIIFT